jgi:hypothetical protein
MVHHALPLSRFISCCTGDPAWVPGRNRVKTYRKSATARRGVASSTLPKRSLFGKVVERCCFFAHREPHRSMRRAAGRPGAAGQDGFLVTGSGPPEYNRLARPPGLPRSTSRGRGVAAGGGAGGGARRTPDRLPSPPPDSARRAAGAGPDDGCRGRVSAPPDTLRQRTTPRLPGGHAREPSGVGQRRASDAGGAGGSPRPA